MDNVDTDNNTFQAAPSAGPVVHEWYDTPFKYRYPTTDLADFESSLLTITMLLF